MTNAVESTVSETMSRTLVSVGPSATLCDAAKLMNERRVGAALVLDAGQLRGILTERDVLRAVARGALEAASVSEWMTPGPDTIEPSDSTAHAAVLMIHGGFRHLPVVEDERVVGMLSMRDLVRVVIVDESPRGV
jgi:CBS domain-containing protein